MAVQKVGDRLVWALQALWDIHVQGKELGVSIPEREGIQFFHAKKGGLK